MIQLFYTTLNCVDLAQYEIFYAEVRNSWQEWCYLQELHFVSVKGHSKAKYYFGKVYFM